MRIGRLALFVAYMGLGIWALAKANYLFGAFWLAIAVAWLLMAVFMSKRLTSHPDSERPKA